MGNSFHQITSENWNQTLRKAKVFHQSWSGKKIRTLTGDRYVDPISNVNILWDKGEKITLKEILTLKLFTDFDQLQHELEKCFRFECDSKKQSNKENLRLPAISKAVIYEDGKMWYFSEKYKNHPNYIKPTYRDLKEELIANASRSALSTLNVRDVLHTLESRVAVLMQTKAAQALSSNGRHGIPKGQSIDEAHLTALLIHTDLTKVDKEYSNILRRGDPAEVSSIAHWTRLLMETVQCFGTAVHQVCISSPPMGSP